VVAGQTARGKSDRRVSNRIGIAADVRWCRRAKLDSKVKFDGFDMLPVLRGDKKSPRTEMFWQRRGDQAARVGNWKWISSAKGTGLYNLTSDLGEERDVSKDHPEVAAKLKARFEAWRKEMDASEPRGPFRDY